MRYPHPSYTHLIVNKIYHNNLIIVNKVYYNNLIPTRGKAHVLQHLESVWHIGKHPFTNSFIPINSTNIDWVYCVSVTF